MKKQLLLGTALSLGAAATFSVGAFATDSSNIINETALDACLIQAVPATCQLGGNIDITSLKTITSDITLDLNGYNLTGATSQGKIFQVKSHSLNITGSGSIYGDEAINTGVIRVYGSNTKDGNGTSVTVGKDVNIKGGNGIVVYNTGVTAYNTTVNVYGHLQGTNSGLWVIGTINDETNYPTINIFDGASVVAEDPNDLGEDSGIGLSAMGYAEYNLGKATITGEGSGLGVKAGIINIDGTTITGTEKVNNLPPALYSNGINASGAAIQIETNTIYGGDIELSLKNATLKSDYAYAIYEYGGASESTNVIDMNIESGSFSGAKGAVSLSAYLADSPIWKQALASGSVITEGGFDNASLTIKHSAEVQGLPVGTAPVIDATHLVTTEEQTAINALNIPGFNQAAAYNITLTDEDGAPVTELDEAATFTLPLPTNISPVANGFTRTFYVIRIHNGEATKLDSITNADGTISFASDKFSTFIVGYADTKDSVTTNSAQSPKTGYATQESTSSAIATIAPLATIATIATLIFTGKKFLKKQLKK